MLKLSKLTRNSYLRQQGHLKRFSSRYQEAKAITDKSELSRHGLEKFEKGRVVQGFTVDQVARVDEVFLTAVRLTHLGTGAQYLHVARDDDNNVFAVSFRTTPTDSTGLPHILEHTTLCGSERYPCRDPFFKMLRRSLATFMNAMTGPDYTIYPFSTQNLKDYRNLQSVYMDSVFKPNLREIDFRQEGWRLEHQDVNDKNSPVVFKGVVFNEMKGVFNENQAILAERLLNSLLPSHTYSVISGGDPLVIPNLRHIDLLNFHKKYYHPSNSRFYSYGNFHLEDHLKFVNDRYLFLADKIDVSSLMVPSEKRWDKPRKEHVACKPDPMISDQTRQGTIAFGHLCNDIVDTQTTFEMHVISQLLLNGPNSAFYKAFIESNLALSFGPITGFDGQCKDTMFVTSLLAIKPEDFARIEETYDQTVEKVIREGFPSEQVEAVLHTIELGTKHQTSNFGLQLLFNLTPLWNHNGDLVQAMRINQAVDKLREKINRDPKYLQGLVQRYFMENPHKLTLTMLPDEGYDKGKEIAEKELLDSKLKKLSSEEFDQIYEDGKTLLNEQQKEEDVNVLPTIKIEDLKKDVERYEITDLKVAGVPLQLAVQPTNGISYFRGIINTRGLSSQLKNLLPLFNNVITKFGTEKYDYRTFDQMMRLKTGGLHFSNHVAEHKTDNLKYEEGILIESYCLDRNATDMWKLWIELFNHVKLIDLERFETLVKTNAADMVNGIAQSGHLYAMSTAASLVSPVCQLKESLSGLQCVGRMKKIAQINDLTLILNEIREIADHVFDKREFRTAINLSDKEIVNGINEFYESIKGTPTTDENDSPFYTFIGQCNNSNNNNINVNHNNGNDQRSDNYQNAIHYVLPYTVNYCSKAIATVPYTDPDYASLQILSKLITSIYLHTEIREKGGAYGGGAKVTSEGVFTFYSYRDPNSTRSFDIFDNTYEFLIRHPFKQTDIDEAKFGIFQRIDAPIPPSNRGITKFLHNLTYDDIQQQRERLKAVGKDELMHVAKKYLDPAQTNLTIGRSLIGPINSALSNRQSENWTIENQEEGNHPDQARALE